jgi:hypothetical protein
LEGAARGRANLVVGVVLVGLGSLSLLAQLAQPFGAGIGRAAWPIYVIVPGLGFFVAMAASGRGAGWLAIPGSIVTAVGLILLYQNTFDHWESWAYAWALVFPTAAGLGVLIDGLWTDRPTAVRKGTLMAGSGLAVFVLFGAFFELGLDLGGLTGGAPGRVVLPVALIAAGGYLLQQQRRRPN